jgi:hypothetical protein
LTRGWVAEMAESAGRKRAPRARRHSALLNIPWGASRFTCLPPSFAPASLRRARAYDTGLQPGYSAMTSLLGSIRAFDDGSGPASETSFPSPPPASITSCFGATSGAASGSASIELSRISAGVASTPASSAAAAASASAAGSIVGLNTESRPPPRTSATCRTAPRSALPQTATPRSAARAWASPVRAEASRGGRAGGSGGSQTRGARTARAHADRDCRADLRAGQRAPSQATLHFDQNSETGARLVKHAPAPG